MFQLVVILLVLGIVLLIAETFFFSFSDFGISGIIGVLSLFGAAVLMIVTLPPWGTYLAILMFVLVVAGIFFFIKKASKGGLLKKLVMEEALNDDRGGVVDLSNFAGKTGVALTPMRPIGTVDFGGVPVEAYSSGAFIDTGDKVIVTSSQENRLYVRRLQNGEKVVTEKVSKPRAN